MKIFAYSVRADEVDFFTTYAQKYGVTLGTSTVGPTLDTLDLAKGYDAISILTTPLGEAHLTKLKEMGIGYISTRTVGFEHIDSQAAQKVGIAFNNVVYSPYTVAEYTVMLMTICLRNIKTIVAKKNIQDFSIGSLIGHELHTKTVGIIGTGKIGKTVATILKGYGCRIIAHDPYPNPELAKSIEYLSLDELLSQADVITMHVPAAKDGSHLLNKKEFDLMKTGVIIINTARGTLINQHDLMDAIESKKIGAAGLDVVQNEGSMYYGNHQNEPLQNRDFAILNSYPNVFITPHTAFHTKEAVSGMVEQSITRCLEFEKSQKQQ